MASDIRLVIIQIRLDKLSSSIFGPFNSNRSWRILFQISSRNVMNKTGMGFVQRSIFGRFPTIGSTRRLHWHIPQAEPSTAPRTPCSVWALTHISLSCRKTPQRGPFASANDLSRMADAEAGDGFYGVKGHAKDEIDLILGEFSAVIFWTRAGDGKHRFLSRIDDEFWLYVTWLGCG